MQQHTGLPLAVSMGEPAGIGGEIALLAWARRSADARAFFLIDDPDRLRRLVGRLGWTSPVEEISTPGEAAACFGHALPVLAVGPAVRAEPGRLDETNAAAVVASIERGVALVQGRQAAALVTLPIQKSVLYRTGFCHPGHTEFLAALAGVGRTVMMLAAEELRVIPVTVHIPLADVPAALTREAVVETGLIAARALQRDFGIARPRLAVAGLNPHAGEGGSMGREEIDILRPAFDALGREGVDVRGPLSADTLFHAAAREGYDAVLCMYHDQALIPIKTLAMDRAVNVTLGLPFVRTSPDHGTALDIAGRGIADPASFVAALRLAAAMAERRQEAVA